MLHHVFHLCVVCGIMVVMLTTLTQIVLHQCFDYDSFLEINEKRPAWRCPCCNRCITWPDIRIDRQMEKVSLLGEFFVLKLVVDVAKICQKP